MSRVSETNKKYESVHRSTYTEDRYKIDGALWEIAKSLAVIADAVKPKSMNEIMSEFSKVMEDSLG